MREYFMCPDVGALDANTANVLITGIICVSTPLAPFAWGWFFGRT